MVLSPQAQYWAGYGLFAYAGFTLFYLLNAFWLELPAFLSVPMPEGNSIANDLNLSAQSGNLVVLLVMALPQRYLPSPRAAVMGMTVVMLICAVALVFFWDVRTEHHSIAMIILMGVVGTMCCLANVFSWPWASMYDASFTTAMSVGMGISAAVPSFIAIGQDPGTAQRFSVSAFFAIAAGLTFIGVLLVFVICYTRFLMSSRRDSAISVNQIHAALSEESPLLQSKVTTTQGIETKQHVLSLRVKILLLFIQGGLIYGWMPGFTPYIMPSGRPLLIFLVVGQLTGIVGRFLAGVPFARRYDVSVTVLECLSFGTMCALGGFSAVKHQDWFTPIMTIANGIFCFMYGLGSTSVMVKAPNEVWCGACDHLGVEGCEECLKKGEKDVQWLGIALTLGSGVGGLGTWLIGYFWLQRT